METTPYQALGYTVQTAFRRYWYLIAFFLAAVVGTVALVTALLPKLYTSEARILLERDPQTEIATLLGATIQPRNIEQIVMADIEIMRSRPIAEEVVRKTGLDRVIRTGAANEREHLDRVIRQFWSRLKTEPLRDAGVIRLQYSDTNPERAASVLQSLIEAYREFPSRLYNRTQTYQFFEARVREAEQRLRDLEAQQMEFQRSRSFISPEVQRRLLADQILTLAQRLTQIRSQRIERETRLRELERAIQTNQLTSIPSTDVSNSLSQTGTLVSLRNRLAELLIQRAKLAETYTPQYPEMRQVEQQIRETRQQLVSEINQSIEQERVGIASLLAAERQLQVELDRLRAQIASLIDQETTYERLRRAIDENDQVYNALLRQREEARIAMLRLQQEVIVTVISPPNVPGIPSSPNWTLNLGLAFLFGLSGGIAVALARAYRDEMILSPADVSRAGIPVIGEIRETTG
ncbi:MAG: GumC family protein [Bacteroidetes bacterium]|nr:GumC family protein [Rhodothermia bacterium]MCS7155418.1 GumC family protein [Bacteroidota bacterium]MCX7907489.1 GumC family protein [Bacteroidota bacterium]MDW8138483.1 GumC family protein [Bacteroidota bacterium]MDW8284580.1 GumC family protein [Bacteroidota bacterium]